MKQQIAVFLQDTEYGDRFVSYLRQMPNFTYEVYYFSDIMKCKEFLETQKVAMLISKEEAGLEQEQLERAEEVVFLTDHSVDEYSKEVSDISLSHVKKINQYQSMEQLIPLLWPCQATSSKSVEVSCKQKQCPSIVNVIYFNQEFSLIPSVAEVIRRKDKTLLVDCSQFKAWNEELSKLQEQRNGYGMSDLIYYLSEDKEFTRDKIERNVTKKLGVDVIRPVSQCLDLFELGGEQIPWLLAAIAEAEYTKVIFMISIISEAMMELIGRSNQLIFVESSKGEGGLQNQLRNQLAQVLSRDSLEKLCVVHISEERDAMLGLPKQLAALLEE